MFEGVSGFHDYLGSGYGGLINRLTYLTQKPYVDLFYSRYLLMDAVGNPVRQKVVDLPNVTNRILSCCCLGTYRSVQRYDTIHSISPANLT